MSVFQFVTSTAVLILLNTIDFLTVGSKYFINLTNLSQFVYLINTAGAHFFFNQFTSVESGCAAGSIVENMPFYTQMEKLLIDLSTIEKVQTLILASYLSTLLFSLFSFLIYYFNLTKKLRNLPLEVLFGLLAGIGYIQITAGFLELKSSYSLMGLGFGGAIMLILMDEYLPFSYLTIPIYIIFGCILKALYLFYTGDTYGFTIQSPEILSIGQYIGIREIQYNKLGILFPAILSLSLVSLLHLPVNFNSYCKTYSIKRELLTQASSNLFLFSPSYMIGCYSVFYKKSGSTNNFISRFSSLFLLLIPFIAMYLNQLVPVFVPNSIMISIGLNFIREPITEVLRGKCDIIDILILLSTFILFISLDTYAVFALFIGIALSYSRLVYYKYKNKRTLSFNNIERAEEKGEYVYVDWLAREKTNI